MSQAPKTSAALQAGAHPLGPLNAAARDIFGQATGSMLDWYASASEGMLLVDRSARVVWINEQYRRFLPALGFASEADFVGQPVSAVVQNTLMDQVLQTGKPILVDLLNNRAGTFVVSRMPLRNAAGDVIGALGVVLFDNTQGHLQPLIAKFSQLQSELHAARQELAVQRRRRGVSQRQANYTLASFVGASPAALEVKRQARRAAASASAVLLQGETGTGKEVLAHAIHAASNRSKGPLVSVNIAAVPDALLEAEFFGVAPGAYTGADRKARDGKFKLADQGTLFLDEIGDMPSGVQAKLLRVLQEGEIEALGSNTLLRVDVRIVAATSRDLAALVREGKFREDLYYRLNVLPIRVPPLRERQQDIAALVDVLRDDLAQRGTPPPELDADAMALLSVQTWRGNIRELRNVLEQAALACDSERVSADQLAQVLSAAGLTHAPIVRAPPRPVQDASAPGRLSDQVTALEQRAISAALIAHAGNKQAAAKSLGISRATLYQRLANPARVLAT